MTTDHPALDHALTHGDVHGASVRIVANEQIEEAAAELTLLFPHEVVLTTRIGCAHACVYTDRTPASLVAERIEQHLQDVERR